MSSTLIVNRINPEDELIVEKNIKIEGNLTVEGSIPLPVGTILMYDGTGWIDNTTMPGWYACTGANGTPDLRDKFIMGGDSPSQTGGNNSITLQEENLPQHCHTINHNHTDGNHDHNVSGWGLMRITLPGENKTAEGANSSGSGVEPDITRTPCNMTTKPHTHTLTGTNSGNGGFANTPVENRPSYYSVIYIKRML